MLAIAVAFWLCVFLVGWVYVGYPALLALLRRAGVRLGHGRARDRGDATPVRSVSVLVAAYNEEAAIETKVRALLASDLGAVADGTAPRSLEILVASDGSGDDTNRIVEAIDDPRVRLLALPRGGKTTALNAAAAEATGDVLVMTDATTALGADALRGLVEALERPGVGCVAAELVYRSADGSSVGLGTGAYWRYETAIRRMEAEVCGLIGCSGALYAVRASYHRPIHAALDDDFTMPWEVYDQGAVTVLVPGALAEEPTNESGGADFRMRVRVALRAIHALIVRRRYTNPLRYGWYAVQLLSHKLLRYLVPWFLLGAFVATVMLVAARYGAIYGVALVAQIGLYGAAAVGAVAQRVGVRVPGVFVPYYFVHLNAAAFVAWLRFASGDRAVTWDTDRTPSQAG